MKNTIVVVCLILFPLLVDAQVTIGSNSVPNKDAVLDLISNANRGLLLPRVALSSTTLSSPLTTHVAGMTVYNTASAGSGATAVKPGLYINNGTKWISMADYALTDKTDDAFENDITSTSVKLKTISDGQTARGTTADFVIKDNGYVGIGTASPTTNLSIAERILIRANTGGDPVFELRGDGWNRIGAGAAGSSLAIWGNGNANVDNNPHLFVSGSNGYFGIGTTTPTQRIDVNGAIKFSAALMPNNNAGTAGQVLTSAGSTNAPIWSNLSTTNTPNIYSTDGTLAGNRTVTQNTNTLAFTSAAISGTSHFTVDGTTLNVDAVNNRLGLGTATPLSRLHLDGENTPTLTMRGNGTNNTAAYPQARISLLESGSTNYGFNINLESPVGAYNSLRIQSNEGGTVSDIVTVEVGGKIGVNITTPTENLDVNGTARVRSLENANAGQPNASTYTRNVVADSNGKLGYVNRTTSTITSYSSKINDGPASTTYKVADYYPVLIGMGFANYASSGGFTVTWDSTGTYWKYDFLAQTNSTDTCSIQIIWIAK